MKAVQHRVLLALAVLGLFNNPVQALSIEGVSVPQSLIVDGKCLPLNGAGLRTVALLFVPIKAYVAAFYSPSPLRSESDVLASSGPLQFSFTFLRSVSQSQVTSAWQSQFKASVTYTYEGFEKDRDTFISMFGALDSGGVEMVRLQGDDTFIFDGSTHKGSIPGKNFQKAFLSLWFGSDPVQDSLKKALLNPNS